MIVQNIRSGQKFETSTDDFQRLIVDQGNGYMYKVVEEDTPIEVKSLREMKLKGKQAPGTITEVNLKDAKTKPK